MTQVQTQNRTKKSFQLETSVVFARIVTGKYCCKLPETLDSNFITCLHTRSVMNVSGGSSRGPILPLCSSTPVARKRLRMEDASLDEDTDLYDHS